jgi:nucleotide-binding universal stress UspA family protein
MKTMLILTDFSENAFRAAEYAAEIAGPLQIKRILLYHAYQTIIGGTDLPIGNSQSSQEIYIESISQLAMVQDRVKSMVKDIKVDLLTEDASLPAYIGELCEAEEVDLMVMGVSGRSGLEKLLLGSTTSMMIEESKVPVLIVPKDTGIGRGIKSLVFTTDLKDHTVIPVHQLYEILDAFPVPVQVLNVEKGTDEKYSEEARDTIASLHNIFEKCSATFDYIKEDNTVEGILSYANQHHASMIIVVPRKTGFLASVFRGSISKKLAYNSNIPLLSLPPAPVK